MDLLQTYLASKGMRQSALADALGINRGYMSELASGRKRPSLDLAFRIAEVTEGAVPVSAWQPTAEASSPAGITDSNQDGVAA